MSTTEIKANNPKVKQVTPSLNHVGLKKSWIVIDLENLVLGRVASFIAHRLMGKHRADYTPHIDCGDFIILLNADKVAVTGKKETDKVYYRHTGYVGGIKSKTVKVIREKKPEEIIQKAVERMIGRGPLAYKQMTRLHVYASAKHPHEAQQPEVIHFAEKNRKNVKN